MRSIAMGRYFCIGFIFIVTWTYISTVHVTQQHGEIKFFDERYFSEVKAFTSRRQRGDPYLTNITFTTRVEFGDNVSVSDSTLGAVNLSASSNMQMKIEANMNGIGTFVFHNMKSCVALRVPWIKQVWHLYTNFTVCPMPPARYRIFNLEIPPKNYPLPVPKGEGTLHLYVYLTHNTQTILHGLIKVYSS